MTQTRKTAFEQDVERDMQDPEYRAAYMTARARIGDALPVRSFRWTKGAAHFPGSWWSSTTGDHVGFESWLERDHVMAMDFDPGITGIASQPFWLHWRDEDGRDRRHAPDFFARRAVRMTCPSAVTTLRPRTFSRAGALPTRSTLWTACATTWDR